MSLYEEKIVSGGVEIGTLYYLAEIKARGKATARLLSVKIVTDHNSYVDIEFALRKSKVEDLKRSQDGDKVVFHFKATVHRDGSLDGKLRNVRDRIEVSLKEIAKDSKREVYAF